MNNIDINPTIKTMTSSDKINILIVEDEPIIAEDLRRALIKAGFAVIAIMDSGEETLEFIEDATPDIILMDVQLEGDLDGIDTAHSISAKLPIPIIYITSNTDPRTFNRAKLTQPFGFLSKPFRVKDVIHTINLAFTPKTNEPEAEAENEISTKTQQLRNYIFVKSKEHLVKINLDDIIYVEADSCYCTIQTSNAKHVIVSTLKRFEELINTSFLIRIHRSFIINLNAIEKIGDGLVYLSNKQIPIGRSHREELFSKIPKY